ncbi:Nif3-like dinuclear metal center hexameric protein [Deefgea sp. CFH1-16]|uniref:Nif3-like dinuclear metal center hexameric protein n=1 Tax=Deefgea sp. CFH1-16 TaxID=2675457 RepID=UPI001B3575B4|nr:Nif3-like dinuclear metal center hexameric protein [Deefgea sp. CFH1-16]
MPIQRQELEAYLAQLLSVAQFKDYAPNGLQVEGRNQIQHIVTGVTASQALIDAAIALNADALLVHHGFFWKSEALPIVRTKKQRIAALLGADLNLFGYHLPLDAHPELGNNAQLAKQLGLIPTGRCGDQNLVWLGELPVPMSFDTFTRHIAVTLNRQPLSIGPADQIVRQVAWCTGGAQGYFHDVANLDVDCFITGEASEFVTHLAKESGVSFIAAGHHATERYGIAALGQHLAQHFGLQHTHLDLDNPV